MVDSPEFGAGSVETGPNGLIGGGRDPMVDAVDALRTLQKRALVSRLSSLLGSKAVGVYIEIEPQIDPVIED